jgi:hypothetical protein
MVQQQAEFGGRIPTLVFGRDEAQIGQIVVVEGDDVGEAAEVRRLHLPPLIAGDIDPMPARHGLSARIGRLSDVPAARACGIHDQIHPQPLRLSPQRRLRQRRATDVAETDEEDGGHGRGHGLV